MLVAVCRLTGTPQQLPRALEILSQHFRENPPREKPGGAPPAIAALLARPGKCTFGSIAVAPSSFF